MNILVTGGAGFIGSNLVDELLKQPNINITCIDNFDDFYDRKIKEGNIKEHLKHKNYIFVEGDIRDYGKLKTLITKPFDAIIHLAAKAGVRPSILNPMLYQEVNVMGTQNLLELAKEYSIPKFVFASSSSVYGVNKKYPWKETDHDLQPISPYASSKLSCEFLGHVYSYLYNIQFIALRFFTVYGPRQRPDLAIHKFFKNIYAGKSIPVYGNGNSQRDYTFVGDAVNGILLALNYAKSKYEIINIGNNSPITLSQLIHSIEETIGKKAIIETLNEQPGDVPITYADTGKAHELLGFTNSTTIMYGLEEFHKWFKKIY